MNRRSFLASAAVGGSVLLARRALASASSAPVESPKSPPPPTPAGRLKFVNTTDLADAIRLGCVTMGSVFDESDHDVPFFASVLLPNPSFGFNEHHSEAHVPGRHLNALLHAEAALGLRPADSVIEKHTRAAFFSYGGALPLPLNRAKKSDPQPTRFLPHNLREGFHALYALTRHRQSAEARELAERSIAAINRLWHPETGWDRAALEAAGVSLHEWGGPFNTGIARAIGPLVKFHQATGHAPALELAQRLRTKALADCFLVDGSYDLKRFGNHTHSTTCVMSSLAILADATGDDALLDRVQVFFENGLKAISDDLGWSLENNSPSAPPDRGEINNTGDILETALILARHRSPAYYERAERILRGHLLPSQLRDLSFTPAGDPAHPKAINALKHYGAFGFPAPYGHMPVEGTLPVSFNLDIVGGGVDSLCYAAEARTEFGPTGHRVNLLFDQDNTHLNVASPYCSSALRVTLKHAAPLAVRIPSWVGLARLSVIAGGKPVAGDFSGGYFVIANPPVDLPIVFSFALAASELVLHHRTRQIRARLEGDRVVAMENFGTSLTYFDPL